MPSLYKELEKLPFWKRLEPSEKATLEFFVETYGHSLLKEKEMEIKRVVAEYLSSEGCSCCEGIHHNKHRDVMCKILDFPRYEDDSGWDYMAILNKEI